MNCMATMADDLGIKRSTAMHEVPFNEQQQFPSRTEALRASPPMFRWPWLDRLLARPPDRAAADLRSNT